MSINNSTNSPPQSPTFPRFAKNFETIVQSPENKVEKMRLTENFSNSPKTIKGRVQKLIGKEQEQEKRLIKLLKANEFGVHQFQKHLKDFPDPKKNALFVSRIEHLLKMNGQDTKTCSSLALCFFKNMPLNSLPEVTDFIVFAKELANSRLKNLEFVSEIEILLQEMINKKSIVEAKELIDFCHRIFLLNSCVSTRKRLKDQFYSVFKQMVIMSIKEKRSSADWVDTFVEWIEIDYVLFNETLEFIVAYLLQTPEENLQEYFKNYQLLKFFVHSVPDPYRAGTVHALTEFRAQTLITFFPKLADFVKNDFLYIHTFFKAQEPEIESSLYLEEIIQNKYIIFPNDFFKQKDKFVFITKQWKLILSTFSKNISSVLFQLFNLSDEENREKFVNLILNTDAKFAKEASFLEFKIKVFFSNPHHEIDLDERLANSLLNYSPDEIYKQIRIFAPISAPLKTSYFTKIEKLLTASKQQKLKKHQEVLYQAMAHLFPYYLGLEPGIEHWKEQTNFYRLFPLNIEDSDFSTILTYLRKCGLLNTESNNQKTINFSYFPKLTAKSIEILIDQWSPIYIQHAFNVAHFSDVQIFCKRSHGEVDEFYVHSKILKRIGFFNRMLAGSFQEGQLFEIENKAIDLDLSPSWLQIEISEEISCAGEKDFLFLKTWISYYYDQWTTQFLSEPVFHIPKLIQHLILANYYDMPDICKKVDDQLGDWLNQLNLDQIEGQIEQTGISEEDQEKFFDLLSAHKSYVALLLASQLNKICKKLVNEKKMTLQDSYALKELGELTPIELREEILRMFPKLYSSNGGKIKKEQVDWKQYFKLYYEKMVSQIEEKMYKFFNLKHPKFFYTESYKSNSQME